MNTRGTGRSNSGNTLHTMGRRLCTGVVGTIAVGGAIFMGGAATLISASAHSVLSTTTGVGTKADGSDFTPAQTAGVGAHIMDSAMLQNYTIDPARVVVFKLYSDGNCTTRVATFTVSPAGATGTQTAGPVFGGPYTTTQVGTYEWTAEVDFNGVRESGTDCGSEPMGATENQPSISTTPSAGGPVGTAITDSATVTGGSSPTGNVTFSLFGAGDTSCASAPVYTNTANLVGATATSGSYTTAAVGTYSWTATYNGDSNNLPVSSACTLETATTTKASPAIATTQSAGGNIGIVLSDTATVSGGFHPTGTVTFVLFPPSNATCSATGTAPVYTSPAKALSGGTASSGSYTTTSAAGAGTYQWVATYSGDANNSGAASGCTTEAAVVSGGGGTQGITTPGITTPATGASESLTGMTVGGLLVISGFGIALVGAVMPRRRRRI